RRIPRHSEDRRGHRGTAPQPTRRDRKLPGHRVGRQPRPGALVQEAGDAPDRRGAVPQCGRARVARPHGCVRSVRPAAGGCASAGARPQGPCRMTPRAWWLFAASSVIWGVPYLFIRIALEGGVPPPFIAWARVALAAALLLPFALRRGALRGLWQHRWPIAAYAACEIAAPFTLISIGERYI